MTQEVSSYYRYCPDQPGVLISDAVCQRRRRVNYPYCVGCRFNEDVQKTHRKNAPPPPTECHSSAEPPTEP